MSRVDGAINVNVSFQIGYNMSPLGLTLENGLTCLTLQMSLREFYRKTRE